MIRFLSGRLDEAMEIATRAFETRSRLSTILDLGTPGVYLVAQALTMCEAGRIEESAATAQFVYDIAVAEQFRDGMAWLAAAIGRSHLLSGRLLDAARAGQESALLFGELNHAGARWGFGVVALARAQLGDVAAAEEALADLDAEPETTMTMMDSELERARGWALAARGDTPRARALMLAAADATAERGLYTLEVALLHDIARIGGAELVADRLAERALVVDGPLMAARVLFAEAVVKSDPEKLEAAAEAFEAIGAMLFAAESANEAAIAYRRGGNTRAASAAAQQAQRLAAECQGARTPALMLGTDTAVLDAPRARSCDPGCPRHVQSRDRLHPVRLEPHRRQSSATGVRETWGVEPRSAHRRARARRLLTACPPASDPSTSATQNLANRTRSSWRRRPAGP